MYRVSLEQKNVTFGETERTEAEIENQWLTL